MEQTIEGFRRIYVWEAPVRIFHWFNVLSILVLTGTGIIIGNPPAIMSGAEATNQYWFGVVRFVHFTFAYLFMLMIAMRVVWAFLGNKYSSWKVFFPYTRKGIHNLLHVLKMDVLLGKPKKFDCTELAVGHNALAAISYFIFFLFMMTQILTGFGLYASMSEAWFPAMFSWVVPLLGGDFAARNIHHIIMWLIIVFSIVHVYLVMYHDWLEGRSEVSSMFGGYKFVRPRRLTNNSGNDKK
jgi:Ni/Fe-hydrogenase 1 B-type cytochrome subunit